MIDAAAKRTVMIALAYLWPLALIPLIVQKDDLEVQWHAKHGLVLMAAETIALGGIAAITSLTLGLATLGLGCMLSILGILLWAVILAIHAVAIIKALTGGRLIVPGVSRFADLWKI